MQHATRLGKYSIHEQLGKGGFGVVYRATDENLGRDVALKVVHPQLTIDPEFLASFRREARLLASLPHSNIVYILDLDERDGRTYIAMEYLPGGSLLNRIQKGPLPYNEARLILEQVCRGAQQAHERDLVHRDIKPANILFNAGGEAVLSDFGLARAISSSSSSSNAAGVGTPFYRAPELWRGKPPASPASDVYSLACVFYEMLTGIVLFSGDTPDVVITKHLVDGPEFAVSWPPADAPSGLEAVLLKALSRDPGERYVNAAELAAALRVTATHTAPSSNTTPVNLAGIEWVEIPSGVHRMGSDAQDEQRVAGQEITFYADEKPAHLVQISYDYQIAKYPVTNAEFGAFIRADGYDLKKCGQYWSEAGKSWRMGHWKSDLSIYSEKNRDTIRKWLEQRPLERRDRPFFWDNPELNSANQPVVGVCWFEAEAYANWLGAVTGMAFRLPTEAEWEKAARYKVRENGELKIWPWGDKWDATKCNNRELENGQRRPSPVGVFPDGASELGIMDLAGNVWEWCQDWYDEAEYARRTANGAPVVDPRGPAQGQARVGRGGSWHDDRNYVRCASRYGGVPVSFLDLLGFRLVLPH